MDFVNKTLSKNQTLFKSLGVLNSDGNNFYGKQMNS